MLSSSWTGEPAGNFGFREFMRLGGVLTGVPSRDIFRETGLSSMWNGSTERPASWCLVGVLDTDRKRRTCAGLRCRKAPGEAAAPSLQLDENEPMRSTRRCGAPGQSILRQ